jgi:hypothetical protein
MADGGRYHRRCFAAFAVSPERVVRKAHQPHYQSRDYNPLNGGIERWFGAVNEAITVHPVTLVFSISDGRCLTTMIVSDGI